MAQKKTITLLSPAGSRESLIAAVQNGADAVYLGGSAFNARRFAGNFSDEELPWAVDYCHARGVEVNITFNTLLFDRELADALSYGRFLYGLGVDSVIVQDLGLARILHENLPDLTLHASTQMGISDLEGALQAKEIGFSRVVLAREVPMKEVRHICDHAGVEVETFAHGAMCMSVSGACLFSSMAGERSGNRGTCAQPCRKRIAVGRKPGEQDYALSLSDLCMLSHVKELIDAGVCCIKLEGRMKRPEYVAAATRAYRAAIDGADAKTVASLKKDVFQMFNRGGDRTGYYYGDGGITDCVAKSEPGDALLQKMQETYAQDARKRGVSMHAELVAGKPALLRMECDGFFAEAEGDVVLPAEKPQDKARYAQQLQKLGATPFAVSAFSMQMDDNAFLPVGKLNALRREACDSLLAKISPHPDVPEVVSLPEVSYCGKGEGIVSALVRSEAQAKAAFSAGADEVLLQPVNYGDDTAAVSLQPYRREGKKLLLSLPVSLISREEHRRIETLLASGLFDGAEANNIGQLSMIKHLPLKIAGSAMNAFNAQCVSHYYKLGFDRIVLSQELTKPQMRDILVKTGGAVTVYGRVQTMQLRHCPVKEREGCRNCSGDAGTLVDEAGRIFPLSNIRQAEGCLVRVLNCNPTDIIDLYQALPPVDAAVLAFYTESPEEVASLVARAVDARSGKTAPASAGSTRGHWSRAVD